MLYPGSVVRLAMFKRVFPQSVHSFVTLSDSLTSCCIEQSYGMIIVTCETFVRSEEKTWPDQTVFSKSVFSELVEEDSSSRPIPLIRISIMPALARFERGRIHVRDGSRPPCITFHLYHILFSQASSLYQWYYHPPVSHFSFSNIVL